MTPLPHHLDRTITIGARRETVFSFFTEDARWASWWGAGSTIEPRPGGKVFVKHPGGVEASGEVLEIHPPDRIVFSFGYPSNQNLLPGSSRVTIRLEAAPEGTRLSLRHEFPEAAKQDCEHHVQGWRYQLSVFANVVADLAQASAQGCVDQWFDAWAEPDATKRESTLGAIAEPSVRFRDRYSRVDGLGELLPHITAAQHFMPGMRIQRTGDIRHCQGTVVANWTAHGPDGAVRGTGTNVFSFGPDGRIEAVTGLWS
jgi:uncharacterized protein YndB with AHSA1/START domain